MTENDFKPTGPKLEEIQCSRCKYASTMEWEGKIHRLPGGSNCQKYPKGEAIKPRGVLFKIVDIDKHQTYDEGHYIKCPYFEEQ